MNLLQETRLGSTRSPSCTWRGPSVWRLVSVVIEMDAMLVRQQAVHDVSSYASVQCGLWWILVLGLDLSLVIRGPALGGRRAPTVACPLSTSTGLQLQKSLHLLHVHVCSQPRDPGS
jgi:hypothetical protein